MAGVCFHHDPSHVFLPPSPLHPTPGTRTRWLTAMAARARGLDAGSPVAGVGWVRAAVCQRGVWSGPAGSILPSASFHTTSPAPPPAARRHHLSLSVRLGCRATVGVVALPAPRGGRQPPTPPRARSAPTGPVPHPRGVPHSARAACPPPRLAAASRSQPHPTGLRVTEGRAHNTGEHGREGGWVGGGVPPCPRSAEGKASTQAAGRWNASRARHGTSPPWHCTRRGAPPRAEYDILLPRNNKRRRGRAGGR